MDQNNFNCDQNSNPEDGEVEPSLDLRKKKLRAIPDLRKNKNIFLFGLKSLDLSCNLITKIDTQRQGHFNSIFSEMKNLEVLDLSHNRIKFLHPNIFSSNQNLRTLNLSHNKLSQEGKLKCVSKLINLESLDISENEIYSLTYLKLSKFIKRFAQNLKFLYFKQINQNSHDLIPNRKIMMKFKMECSSLVHWDFSDLDEEEEQEGSRSKLLSRRKSQPNFFKDTEKFDKSPRKLTSKPGYSKKFIKKRERRKSQVFLRKQQKVPSNIYSKTPSKQKKWITKSPDRRKSVLKDITNLNQKQLDDKKKVRTISKILSRVVNKSQRKTAKKKAIEFSEVKKNLKKFFKRNKEFQKETDSDQDYPYNTEKFPRGKKKYEIEDFEDMENSPSRLRSSTPGFTRNRRIENRIDKIIRESISFRMNPVRSEFDRRFKNLKSIIGVRTKPEEMIPPEEISKEQIVSPSVNFGDAGISFGIQPQAYNKDAIQFKKMI